MVDETEMPAGETETEAAAATEAQAPAVDAPAEDDAPTFTQSRSSQAAKPVEDPDKMSLDAEPRTVHGRRVGQLRREGWTPAILYGKGMEPMSLQVNTKTFMHVAGLTGGEKVLRLNVAGQKSGVKVRIQSVQRHITRLSPSHIDFIAV